MVRSISFTRIPPLLGFDCTPLTPVFSEVALGTPSPPDILAFVGLP